MIITEEEAIARLESKDNLINKINKIEQTEQTEQTEDSLFEHTTNTQDRSNIEIEELYKNRTGPKNIPPMIQTLAVEHALVSTEQSAAQTFGMRQQTVNYYKHGGGKVDRSVVKDRMDTIHTNAVEAMLTSIGLIKDKLPTVKRATDLSKIAADMSRVIDKTTIKDNNSGIKIVVFAPNMKMEDDYEEAIVNS